VTTWKPVEFAGWAAQIAAIALLLRARARDGESHLRNETPWLVSALVISLAWCWRLAYQFVLEASGFSHYVADDPCRWLLAWSWAEHPYVLTWDGVWQGATFYLHGLAMRLGPDPLTASKFVSAVYPLIGLVGLFVFTLGLYQDRVLATASVAFAAPWWHHILLGTGAMAELPVLGFVLGGTGLFFIALRSAERRRRVFLLLSALSFAVATAFHVIAWMALTAFLLAAFGYAISKEGRTRFGPGSWFAFAVIATSYCVIWTVGSWLKFGDPLAFVRNYADTTIEIARSMPLGRRITAYPGSLIFTIFGFLPLAAWGVFEGIVRKTEERARVRCVIAATAGFFLFLLAVSIRNPGGPPHRLTFTPSALLVPIALASLRPVLAAFRTPAASIERRGWTVALAAVVFVVVCWFVGNHLKTIGLQHSLTNPDSDATALGVWLRQEIGRPQTLGPTSPAAPVRLWLREPSLYPMLDIVYAAGYPDRVVQWKGSPPVAASMRPGQYLVSDREVQEPALVPISRLGRFTVYRMPEK
jgi:hypothetical protein